MQYWVCPPSDSNLFWCSKLNEWIEPGDARAKDYGKSSNRKFRTKKRAFAHINNKEAGWIVVQLSPHCGWKRKLGRGNWLIREWIKND